MFFSSGPFESPYDANHTPAAGVAINSNPYHTSHSVMSSTSGVRGSRSTSCL